MNQAIMRHRQRSYTTDDLRHFASEIALRMATAGSVFSKGEIERLDDIKKELHALAVAIRMETGH